MKDFNFDDNAKKSVFEETNKILKDAGLDPMSESDYAKKLARQEGGNGFMVGEIIKLTGAVSIQVVKNTDGTGNAFYAAETVDGRFLSIRNLIDPNLVGYKFEGEFHENNGRDGEDRVEAVYTAEAIEGFKPIEYKKLGLGSRNVIELFAAIKAGVAKLPSEIKLVARGCREFIARDDVNQGTLDYVKGAHRVMRVNVFAKVKD